MGFAHRPTSNLFSVSASFRRSRSSATTELRHSRGKLLFCHESIGVGVKAVKIIGNPTLGFASRDFAVLILIHSIEEGHRIEMTRWRTTF